MSALPTHLGLPARVLAFDFASRGIDPHAIALNQEKLRQVQRVASSVPASVPVDHDLLLVLADLSGWQVTRFRYRLEWLPSYAGRSDTAAQRRERVVVLASGFTYAQVRAIEAAVRDARRAAEPSWPRFADDGYRGQCEDFDYADWGALEADAGGRPLDAAEQGEIVSRALALGATDRERVDRWAESLAKRAD